MLQYARYPQAMFSGSPETLESLRLAIQRMTGR
jgi:hypothetical protein